MAVVDCIVKASLFNSKGRESDDSKKYHHNTEQTSSNFHTTLMSTEKNMMDVQFPKPNIVFVKMEGLGDNFVFWDVLFSRAMLV